MNDISPCVFLKELHIYHNNLFLYNLHINKLYYNLYNLRNFSPYGVGVECLNFSELILLKRSHKKGVKYSKIHFFIFMSVFDKKKYY